MRQMLAYVSKQLHSHPAKHQLWAGVARDLASSGTKVKAAARMACVADVLRHSSNEVSVPRVNHY